MYFAVPKEPAKLIFWPLIGWSSVAAIVVGTKLHKPATPVAWRFIATGTALFILGDNLYTFRAQIQQKSMDMFPSYVDVVYLAMYPTMIIGLAMMVRCRTKRERAAVIDAAIITSAIGLLAWVILIAPYLVGEMSILARLTSIAYPLADVALLAIGVYLAVGGGTRSKAFWLLTGSVVPLIIADSLYGYMNLMGTWHEHNPVDAFWILFYLGWGTAALHPSMRDLTVPAKTSPSLSSRRLIVVAAAALMPPTVLLVEQATGSVDDAVAIGIVGIALFSLVFFRISGLARMMAKTEGESRFRALVQNASDAIVVLADAGKVVYESPSTERVLGGSLMDFGDREFGDFLHPADRQKLRSLLARPDQSAAVEWRLRDGDTWRYIDVVAADLRSEASVQGVSLTVRDSTERKRLAAEREPAVERANEASRQKSVFLANMSHEIRTPLNGLMGMLSLARATSLDDEQRDYFDTMSDSAESLAALVNDVLDFSRIEAGRLELDSEPFSLRAAVDAGLSGSMSAARQKGIEMYTVIENDVSDTVVGDRLRLRQVLSNLAANAVKFTDNGSIVVTVAKQGEMVQFNVVDTGIGLSASNRDKLFEQYVQADSSTTRRHGGSGLGLAICRQLVELMGGEIGVESELGHGSHFWFTVSFDAPTAPPEGPLVDALVAKPVETCQLFGDEPIDPTTSAVAPTRPPELSRCGRVLVVEDNKVNQKVAVAVLTKMGHTVDVANDGVEALERLETQRYDVILMDCQMPRMDGYEATIEIRNRERGRRTPIVAMTASATSSDRDRCLEVGMDEYVNKPVDPVALERLIASVLTGNRLRVGAYSEP